MKFEQYKIAFEKEASNSGYTIQNINKCLTYAENLYKNNVPVIYNTSHLASLVGYNKNYLKKAVIYTPRFYRDFKILKKNGKKRAISEPLPSLKEIQIWVLNNILYQIKVSPFSKAYRKEISLVENLRYHKNQKKVLTIDIENFFTSIKTDSIQSIFENVGYSPILSNLLAKLCTRNGSLPQGAPTSPYLSNIFFNPMDDTIAKYCLSKNIKYTRYADDLSFSGDFDENELLNLVESTISKSNLKLNKLKTKVMHQHMRQTVTGIVVNQKPQVVFHKRNNLRKDIYYIKKFGLKEHMKYRKIERNNYLNHLIGQVNFVLQLNPSDKEFQEYKAFLIEEIRKEKLLKALPPTAN